MYFMKNKMNLYEFNYMVIFKFIVIFVLLMANIFPANSQGIENVYEYNNRILVERQSKLGVWNYSVKEYTDSIVALRAKINRMEGTPYPHYDYNKMCEKGRDLREKIIKCFSSKEKYMTKRFSLSSVYYMLCNDGSIIPNKLTSNVQLTKFCSTEELITLFDMLSNYRFYYPIVPEYEKGYLMWGTFLHYPAENIK